MTGAHVSDDTLYELVMAMASSKEDLARAYGVFNRYDPQAMVRKSAVPYHPGAIKAHRSWESGRKNNP